MRPKTMWAVAVMAAVPTGVLAQEARLQDAGVSYSFHSDMPMAPGQPLFLMWSGVNRITNDGNLRGPEQRVSRMGALEAVTLDPVKIKDTDEADRHDHEAGRHGDACSAARSLARAVVAGAS